MSRFAAAVARGAVISAAYLAVPLVLAAVTFVGFQPAIAAAGHRFGMSIHMPAVVVYLWTFDAFFGAPIIEREWLSL